MYIVKVDKQKAIYNIVAGINYTISFLPYKFICCIVFIYFVHNVKNQDKSILSTFQMIPFFVRVHPSNSVVVYVLPYFYFGCIHFQQYFSYTMLVSFICGGNRRKTTDLLQVTDKHNVVSNTLRHERDSNLKLSW